MKLLTSLDRKENTIEIVRELLALQHVSVTETGLEHDLQKHPDYPSMLSVSDTLTSYGVENISIKTTAKDLLELPMPCVAPIYFDHEEKFTILVSVSPESVSFYNPKKLEIENMPFLEFADKWRSNVLMLINADEARGERGYQEKRRIEIRDNLYKSSSLFMLPAFVLLACIWYFNLNGTNVLPAVFYTILTLIGFVASGLLLLYEIDEHNSVLQQICKAGKKVNCNAIITSGASKIFGISWSSIGFVYFAGSLILLLTQGLLDKNTLFTLAWLNTLTLPYIIFSIFYQWRIARQWCVLCLTVQSILFLQAVITFSFDWQTGIALDDIMIFTFFIRTIFAFSIPIVALAISMPALRKNKISEQYQKELQRFKHNSKIFNTLLENQKTFTDSTEGLGIILGSNNPKFKIIKVCNPFCGPCAKAHAPMEELLHNNPDIQLQIIFSVSDQNSSKSMPIKHFMAIQEKHGENVTKQALDDWYLSPVKDYDSFSSKYPMNGEIELQSQKVKEMHEWCDKTQISFTPTFIVNGYQLPEMYSVSDLKYLLSV